MKRWLTVCLSLCVILALCLAAMLGLSVWDKVRYEKKLADSTTPLSVYMRFSLDLSLEYDVFREKYGDILTKEEFDDLSARYDASDGGSFNLCMLETLKDGTRVLLIMEPLNVEFTSFKLKSVEILD